MKTWFPLQLGSALKEKLRMAELLTEVRFLEERQTAEFKAQKLKVEELYPKSRGRVKVLEDLKGDNFNPAISHNSKICIAYNPVNNLNKRQPEGIKSKAS